MAADWEQIKIQYITGHDSYRALAEQYGVSLSQIYKHSRSEGWISQREQYNDETTTKTVESIGDQRAERMARIQNTADVLLRKLEEAIEKVDADTLVKNAKLPRGLTGAIMDIKNIMDLKSDNDMAEQEARIAKLRADCNTVSDEDDETGVLMMPPMLEDSDDG